MQGVAAGTPGTIPTNWTLTKAAGLNSQVVGSGIANGVPYVDLRVFGTTTDASLVMNLGFEASTVVAAAIGQTWDLSAYFAIVGGAMPGGGFFRFTIQECDNIGAHLAYNTSGNLTLSQALTRFDSAKTLGNASTAFVRPTFWVGPGAIGTVVDITVRVGGPQLENLALASPLILNANVADTATTATTDWPQSNLLRWSEDFTKSAWIKVNCSAAPSSVRSPDGERFQCLIEAATNAAHYACQDITVAPGAQYTASVLARANARTKIHLFWANTANTSGGNCIFDLAAGTAGAVVVYGTGSGYSVAVSMWSPGVYRISITGVLDATSTTGRIRIGLIDSTGAFSYAGSAVAGPYVFGAMVNAGSVPGDYIRTMNAARTVTCLPGGAYETVASNAPRFEYDSQGLGRGLLITNQVRNRVINADFAAFAVGSGNNAYFTSGFVAPYGVRFSQEVPARYGDRVIRHWYDGVSGTNVGGQPNTVLTGFTAGATVVAFMSLWVPSAYTGAANTISVNLESNVGANSAPTGLSINPDMSKRDQWQVIGVQATLTAGQTSTAMVLRVSNGSSPIYSCGWVCTEDVDSTWCDFVPTQGSAATKAADYVICSDLSKLGYSASGFAVSVAWEHATIRSAGTFPVVFAVSKLGGSDYFRLYLSNTNNLYAEIAVGGVSQGSTLIASGVVANTKHRLTVAILPTGFSVSVDGAASVAVSAPVPITAFNTAYLGCWGNSRQLNGVIADYTDWNRVVSNDEQITESAVA